MVELCKSKDCTGCSACVQSCPKNCISFITSDEGFYYPRIDGSNCISCKKCVHSCPVLNKPCYDSRYDNPIVCAIYTNNKKLLLNSASGGVFSQVATALIERKYSIYGAAFDNQLNVSIVKANTKKELERITGSKYIQANNSHVYLDIKSDLLRGHKVFYCGTPCQVAGLYSFLGGDSKNLITADIVCHGVPSDKLWKAYLNYLQTQKSIKPIDYKFRDKTKWGWGSWGSYSYLKGNMMKKHYFPVASDYYYSLFFKENCLRESCYSCRFKGINSVSDFTIGDYWGIERAHPHFYNKNGVSVVLVHTEKAKNILKGLRNQFSIQLSTAEKAICGNKSIISSTIRPKSRDLFYKELNKYGFEITAKKYVHLRRIVPYISRYVPKRVKWKISRIIPKLSRKMVDSI
ncbi:MAG: Coenzyme F420 hydrogenase/dehydrogenase, beta subunit C-terminal domain [Ruminococcus sp.]|nr:Coenzyme F420 hydrogenase/dehydrogenase, beta subunit C-terminal domain [Ruminococcus sp.]